MSKIQCFGCNEYKHFRRDHPNKKNNKRKERSEVEITKVKGEDPKDLQY